MTKLIPDGCVIISKERLDSLEAMVRKYGALVEFGVDNWEGYDEALSSLEEEDGD